MSISAVIGHGATTTGSGGLGAQTALTTLIHDFAPGLFRNTINDECPLLGKKGVLERRKAKGSEQLVTGFVGTQSSTAWVKDFQLLQKGSASVPFKGRVMPSTVMTILEIGREAADAEIDNDEGMASLFEKTCEAGARDAARHIGRGLYGGSVAPQAGATWTSTAANATVSVDFLDVSMFRAGMAVDFIDTSLALAYTVRVTSVTHAAIGANSADVAGTVAFINDVVDPATSTIIVLGATAIVTTDFFKLRGTTLGFGAASTTVSGNPITSFDDIAGAGALSTLYGIDPTVTAGWVGATRAVSAAYSQEAVTSFMGRLKNDGAQYPTHVLMNPILAGAHAASGGIHGTAFGATYGISAATPMTLDSSRDKYGALFDGESGLRVGGRPIVEDPNCPATQLVLHNNKCTFLAVWRELAPETQGSDTLLVSQTYNTYVSQIRGSMALVTDDRKSTGTMTGFTSL